MVELPVIEIFKTDGDDVKTAETFDKTSSQIAKLVNKSWFSRYPRPRYVIYDNGSKFKLHFHYICKSYGLKLKHNPTTIKNPQANAILERVNGVIGSMFCTSEIDMADSVDPDDVDDFVSNAS